MVDGNAEAEDRTKQLMTRARFTFWKLLIAFLIAADLVALWVWAARPRSIYLDWLGLSIYADDAPINRLDAWARWKNGPRTPSGCILLFEIGELFFAGALLFALLVLVAIPLARRRSDGSFWRRLSAPISLAGAAALRFRVRTAIAAIAIIGLYLGWEIHAWRMWRLRSVYLTRLSQAAAGQDGDLARLRTRRSMLADLMKVPFPRADDAVPKPGYYRSRASRIAERLEYRDRLKREIEYLSARIAARAALLRKYERAAAHPGIAVEADVPFPAQERVAHDWGGTDPASALVSYDELTRLYPDLVEAHLSSAWIRATHHDARYRDGKLAVKSATRACDLTEWKDSGACRFWRPHTPSPAISPRPSNGSRRLLI